MIYFEYGENEIAYLKKQDETLAKAIDKIGMIKRVIKPDLFSALINSIVSQQISNQACETVWKRLIDLVGEVTITNIKAAKIEDIQKCGMSMRKAEYIKSAAEADLDFEKLRELGDEEIIKILSSLRGVGVWTAQMLMIFSLQRPDVISYDDLAIRRGIMRLYGLQELTKKEFAVYKERYSPYASVASIYLWEISV